MLDSIVQNVTLINTEIHECCHTKTVESRGYQNAGD